MTSLEASLDEASTTIISAGKAEPPASASSVLWRGRERSLVAMMADIGRMVGDSGIDGSSGHEDSCCVWNPSGGAPASKVEEDEELVKAEFDGELDSVDA